MNNNKYIEMTSDEFTAYNPKEEPEFELYREEAEYRSWCEEMKLDSRDENSREWYQEIKENRGDGFWGSLDENERLGWEDNMNKC